MMWCDCCKEAVEPKWYWEYIQQDEAVRQAQCPYCGSDLVEDVDTCPLCGEYKPWSKTVCPVCEKEFKADVDDLLRRWRRPSVGCEVDTVLEVLYEIYGN